MAPDRGAVAAHPSQTDGLPRDHQGRGGMGCSEPTRARPASGRRPGGAPDPRRLYGYEVSPVLWRKVLPRLSAGRVQSVATRIIVERERERMAFRAATYWDLEGLFEADSAGDQPATFNASLLVPRRRQAGDGQGFHRARCTEARGRGRPRRGRGPGPRRGPAGRRDSRSPRWRRNRSSVPPMRRSSPRRCSRKPGGSCGSRRNGRCRSRSVSTRTDTSLI